jgi:hypothetical protein
VLHALRSHSLLVIRWLKRRRWLASVRETTHLLWCYS